ncbi:PLP-dependent aminotransferase family protein [Streptomyces alboflavus]|uniref:MocR-like pyridoxine biosynthesis transcription factor PdxR n=1 Tax=Streptomyces alboflavus TaxID=67267 RepID=UPI0004C1EB78|nr:PLP-dependent aminotransferase family protein [Streptomyces alboflavus]
MRESWPIFGVDLHLEIDPALGRQRGLEQALRAAIRSRRLVSGTRLPATRRLAADLGLSRGTVRGAYDQLVAEGYLTADQGSGTAVAQLPHLSADVPGEPSAPAPEVPWHDLRPGRPDASAFPVTAWLRSARRALTAAPADAYAYGDPRGQFELRTAVAAYLGRTRGVLAHPDRIVITNGYVQALALLTRVLAENGPATVAMEDPGAAFHREVVRRAGATVAPLPVDDRGARTDLLATFPSVDAVEVTPAHQYPTGHTLHPARRRELVAWARSTSGLVIENDYDGEFRYDRHPVGAIQGTAAEHVAYVGTVSKTLGPALRLGWVVCPRRLLTPLVEAKQYDDHHTEVPGQLTLADFIDSHAYDRHIRTSRLRYQRRRDQLLARLRALPGPPARRPAVHGIAAGLHVLLSLPDQGPTEEDVLSAAAARALRLGRLNGRWHASGDHPQGVIIGYGTPSEHAYPAALDALTDALDCVYGAA